MDDLIGEFITETSENLQMLDSELVKLEQDPSNSKILGNIFRIVHTIKGTCGFLGLPRLESVAHASENVLGKIRDNVIVVTPQAISLVLESLDCIKVIVEYLSNNGEEPAGEDSMLTGRLNAFAESNGVTEIAMPKPAADGNYSEADLEAMFAAAPGPDGAPSAAPPAAVAPIISNVPAVKPKEAHETAPQAPTEGEGSGGNTQSQSIRVNLDVLENLMQMVGELVLTRNQLLQIVRSRNDHQLSGPLQHLSQITSELQEGIMKTRMQPIGNAWSKFPRLIRDLSHELAKKIDLKMVGEATELDRQILEMIKDPLTHMVRNSVDHGLENPADRRAAGKTEIGTVTLSAFHEGGHIIIEISDDGRGLNLDRIKQKAIDNELATASELASLSDQQIMQFIFRAGFSTAEKVTSVSGRGVGMDVVRNNIERIGGTVELSSIMGAGSTFTIKIPLTLAIVSVLIVESAGERFALPQINVQEVVRVGAVSDYSIEKINNAYVLRLREKLLPLLSLSKVLELDTFTLPPAGKSVFIAVCRVGAYSFGLIVDRVYDTEEIVVKPTPEILKHIPLYSGNTILGDGNVIMILDPNGLARATGEREITGGREDPLAALKESVESKNKVNFLLFKTGNATPKAVPLELVSRLEEIDLARMELSGEYPVIQYRGELMRIRTLTPQQAIPTQGKTEVVVFTYDGRTLGLIVDEIIDIVRAPYDIKMASSEKGLLGSMVLEGKTTDIIDVVSMINDGMDTLSSHDKPHAPVKLLLVEDSPFFRQLTVPFLSASGYKVTAVESAIEALAHLKNEHDYNVIVSDIEMPEMDGFAFAEICHNNPQYSHIPLFAFTSLKNDQSIAKGKKAGFTDIILKTDRAALLQAVAIALSETGKEHV